MTPKERVIKIVGLLPSRIWRQLSSEQQSAFIDEVDFTVREAIAEEREACAKVAEMAPVEEEFDADCPGCACELAAKYIRARK